MRHTVFVALLVALFLSTSAPDATAASGDPPAPPVPSPSASAGPDSAVTETISLTYAKPGDIIRTLRQENLNPLAENPKSAMPVGIVRLSHDDAKKTITVWGSAEAITDMKAMVRLMDVRPLYLNVRLRLIEVDRGEDGRLRETVLQSQTLTIANNAPALVSIPSPLRESTSFSVTPQLNGDKSISITAIMGMRYADSNLSPQLMHTSAYSSSAWLRKPGVWKPLPEVSVMYREQLQKAGLTGPIDLKDFYVRYRWEIAAAEKISTIAP